MKKKSPSNIFFKQFTAVEFIFFTTLILCILSFVIPFIYQSIGKAKRTLCSSNQRSIGTWINMYSETFGGYLPAYEDGWIKPVAALGSYQIDQNAAPAGTFSCPSQKFLSLKEDVEPVAYWRGSFYGINQHIASNLKHPPEEPHPQWTQLIAKTILDPTIKVLLADTTGSNYFKIDGRDPTVAGISLEGVGYVDSLPPDNAIPLPSLRHIHDSGNFLFLDGHVESLSRWPNFMSGPGTDGYYFWNGEHRYR